LHSNFVTKKRQEQKQYNRLNPEHYQRSGQRDDSGRVRTLRQHTRFIEYLVRFYEFQRANHIAGRTNWIQYPFPKDHRIVCEDFPCCTFCKVRESYFVKPAQEVEGLNALEQEGIGRG